MTRSGRDVFEGLRRTRDAMEAEYAAWRQLQASTGKLVRALPGEIDQAWGALTAVAVPSLEPNLLDAAAARLGLPDLSAARAAQHRRADAEAQVRAIAEVEADVAFVEREARRNACEIRLAEVDDAIAPLRVSTRALEDEPLFLTLMEEGYGTERYRLRFWHMAYYHHWQHADLVVERHGARAQAEDFAGVARRYQEEKAALQTLLQEKEDQEATLQRLASLEQKWTSARDAQQNLDVRALAFCRARVREHLQSLPPDELTQLLALAVAPNDPLRLAGVRVLGLNAKQEYLARIASGVIEPFGDEFQEAIRAHDLQTQKMARPKKWSDRIDDSVFNKRIGAERVQRWRERRGQIERTRNTIASFDRYDAYDAARDALWWDTMTDRADMPFDLESARRNRASSVLFGSHDRAGDAAARAQRSRASDRNDDVS